MRGAHFTAISVFLWYLGLASQLNDTERLNIACSLLDIELVELRLT